MAKWISRFPNTSARTPGSTAHPLTFPAATAGQFLMIVVGGPVTQSWPAGWTKRAVAVSGVEVSIGTRTAAGGETSVTVTGGAANFPLQYVAYAFPAGTTWGASVSNVDNANPPAISGMTGTNLVMSASSRGVGASATTYSASWTAPFVEDLDAYLGFATTDGAYLTVGYLEDSTAASVTPARTLSSPGGSTVGENITWRLTVPAETTAVTGNGAAVGPAGQVAGAAAVRAPGAGALTGPAGQSVGSAAVVVPAAGAAAGPAGTAAGAGTVTTAGSGQLAGAAGQVAGTGAVRAPGSSALESPAGALAGSAAVIASGSGALIGPPGAMAGAGTVVEPDPDVVAGSAALVAPAGVLTGAGTITAPATGTLLAPTGTLAGSAVTKAPGSGTVSGPAGTLAGQAVVRVVGSGQLVGAPGAVSGTGSVRNPDDLVDVTATAVGPKPARSLVSAGPRPRDLSSRGPHL